MNFYNKLMVIDNFIDEDYQEKIKTKLLGSKDLKEQQFPWYHVQDVTEGYENDSKKRPGLAHQYVSLPYENDDDLDYDSLGKVVSEHHNLFIPLLKKVGYKLGLPDVRVLQGRSFLQFPINTDGTVDVPHVDIHGDIDFIVALYYVVDSDGDTLIYNERYKGLEGQYTIKESVTPKQGRLVIFDGRLYHTAKQPINSNTRCIVNYNLAI